jgi:hypothetical protein
MGSDLSFHSAEKRVKNRGKNEKFRGRLSGGAETKGESKNNAVEDCKQAVRQMRGGSISQR